MIVEIEINLLSRSRPGLASRQNRRDDEKDNEIDVITLFKRARLP